jgi:hypothetical protein
MQGRQRLTAKLLSGYVRCVQLDEMSLVCQIYVGPLPRNTYLLRRELTGRRPHLYEYFYGLGLHLHSEILACEHAWIQKSGLEF